MHYRGVMTFLSLSVVYLFGQVASPCAKEEQVIFSCPVKKKVLAVCAGPASGAPESLQYRFGPPGKAELQFPADKDGSLLRFRRDTQALISGTGESLAFVNGGVVYEVFSQDGRDAGGGVTIRKGSGKPTVVACTGALTERWEALGDAVARGDTAAAVSGDRCWRAATALLTRLLAAEKGQLDGMQQGELFEAATTACAAWPEAGAECVAGGKWPCPQLSAEQRAALEAKQREIVSP